MNWQEKIYMLEQLAELKKIEEFISLNKNFDPTIKSFCSISYKIIRRMYSIVSLENTDG